jgi:hypothetical protein
MKIATFNLNNNKKIFRSIIDAPKIGDKYFAIANSTTILPNILPDTTQYLSFENDKWVLYDKQLGGVYYNKLTGETFNIILEKDADLYTAIKPLLDFNDGTTQKFNEQLQCWEYTEKGSKLLALELEDLKKKKTTEIKNDYEKSQKVLLKNGKSVLIKTKGEEYKDLQTEFNKSSYRIDKLAIILIKDLIDKKRYKLVIPRSFGKLLLAKIQNLSRENFFRKEIAIQKIERDELTLQELSVLKVDFIFNSEININTEADNYINDPYYKTKYPEDIDFVIKSNKHFFTELNAE